MDGKPVLRFGGEEGSGGQYTVLPPLLSPTARPAAVVAWATWWTTYGRGEALASGLDVMVLSQAAVCHFT